MENLEDLVVRAQLGDQRAYDGIVRRFQAMALKYAYSILGDYEMAEDARQDAFIDAYCDLLSLRDPAAFPGWFRTIVRRHSSKFVNQRRILTVPLDQAPELVSPDPGPAQIAQQEEQYRQAVQAIDHLPASEGEATRLYYIDGLSLREIGRRTGTPEKTVKTRLHTARARLRQRLMKSVKTMVSKRHLSGDPIVTRAATAEAIELFGEEIGKLQRPAIEGDPERAGNLICARGRMLRFMGRMDEAIASLREGMEMGALKRQTRYQARLRAEMGLTYVMTSDYGRARRALQASRALLRRQDGSPILLASIHNGLGMCAWGVGDYPTARRCYRQTLKICREGKKSELENQILEAEARNNLALLDWKGGRLDQALEHWRFALRCWKRIQYRQGWALTLMNIGIVEEGLGRIAAAGRHYREALSIAREVNFVQVQSACHANLANLALARCDWKRAIEDARQSLELARRIGDRRSQAIAHENLALAHVGRKDFKAAAAALRAGRKIAEAIGDRERQFSLELVEVESLLLRDRVKGISGRLERAQREMDLAGFHSDVARLLRLQTWAQWIGGESSAARATLRRAVRICRKQKNRAEEKRLLALEKKMDRK